MDELTMLSIIIGLLIYIAIQVTVIHFKLFPDNNKTKK